MSRQADVAIAQAENGVGGTGPEGPANMRVTLAFQRPAVGEALSTFAYPENAILDFTQDDAPPELRGDYFTGTFLAEVESDARPFIRLSHYETSVEIRSGASGSPIFDSSDRVVGIACRGWDFRGGELEGANLSSILPVRHLLPIEVGGARIPRDSWEFRELPESRRDSLLTLGELVAYRHVDTST